MLNRPALLKDLQGQLRKLEADLRQRHDEMPEVRAAIEAEYKNAKEAERTAQNYEDWLSDYATQVAAAWVLSCVFARFLEDNKLVEPPKMAGPGDRLNRARDEHEIFFRAFPTQTDRDYLLSIFDDLAKLPGTQDVFGEHNPIHELSNWLGPDAAGELLKFFQRIDSETGALVHDFTDPEWDTRFLGDLYQDLSEAARKKYALLQTPEFVEEFILDRTLDPAIEEFGLDGFKMIDPACGSGHFLLGAFRRIEALWEKKAPNAKCREVVQSALDSIFGVDVNPFAVAIARFRLLLAALRTCGVLKLAKSPAFHVNLACGDSLYHGRQRQQMLGDDWTDEAHYFAAEDAPALRQILRDGTYHCVVANPPYITPKDRAANEAYRKLYPKTCHMKYSLAVPFMERIYRLAVPGGFTGQITANSFMKREFGKKLIEQFLPQVDLTHVIDTSGAYIPGHGTPTVILFGRHRKPVADTIRTVMGIRGEPSTPDDPARGLVWLAIVNQIDQPASQSEFVSVADSPREVFHKHPWSIGGGGAAELKAKLEENAPKQLSAVVESIGFMAISGEDDVFVVPRSYLNRHCLVARPLCTGDVVRDWEINTSDVLVFPYDDALSALDPTTETKLGKCLWPRRCLLAARNMFGKTIEQHGFRWCEYIQFIRERVNSPRLIAFAFVATHNHFVMDRGGKIFNRSSPVIKLPGDATEDEYVALLGPLNSSTGCFWMKQTFQTKGSSGIGRGVYDEKWESFYEYTNAGLQPFPLPAEHSFGLTRLLNKLSQDRQQFSPTTVLRSGVLSRQVLAMASASADETLGQMIALQEELDWECYRLYGLTEECLTLRREDAKQDEKQSSLRVLAPSRGPPAIALGQRAFEIVMARKMAAGELQTTWFERHGSTPITELPADWPADYRQLVERRIELMERDPNLRLIEQPEYKRRWNTEPWDSQLERALREWLLDRLESCFDFDGRMNDGGKPTAKLDIAVVSTQRLADVARQDERFMQVGELYRDDPAFDVAKLVTELVEAESVPLLPVLRYKDSGFRKRQEWEKTWDLQREEDRRTSVVSSPVSVAEEQRATDQEPLTIRIPPKYTSADFQSSSFWRLRGKLDVPKERWVSFPHCEADDGSPMIAWAGYDHLQLARAVSAYFVQILERTGGRDDPRLVPLLGCLIELLPWLKQWHNEVDAEFGMQMGDYFEGFVNEEARQLGKTLAEIREWKPAKKGGKGKKRK